jgi:hypothetical protein
MTPKTDPHRELAEALAEKIAGRRVAAYRRLNALCEAHPGFALAFFELAQLKGEDGQGSEALRLARAARAADGGGDFRIALLLLQWLHANGRRAEAHALAAEITPRSAEEARWIAVMNSFGDYLQAFPHAAARAMLDEVRRRYRWIGVHELAERVGAALDARRGFALIRLGDGEGAFARVDGADEARFSPLYGWMRDDWFRFQFGPQFDAWRTGYEALTRQLMPQVMEADILGVPYPGWIDHEYRIASPRGVPCVVNIHRHLLAADPDPGPVLCDQIVHLHLHDAGLIEPLVRRAGKVTAITCLPDLPGVMKRRFGLEEADLIPVPREDTAPHLRQGQAVEGAHFPDVFWRTVKRLETPPGGSWEGRLFVVAAGTMGKFYSAVIKRHGGVALDLGSLVDGWLKLPSRAGYGDQFALEPEPERQREPA